MLTEDYGMDYDYRVDRDKSLFAESYVALITGPDPNYYLHRVFLPLICYGRSYSCELYDGIYELPIKYFSKETKKFLRRERKWLIVLDEDLYEYNGDEMNYQYVLYTAGMLRLQRGATA